MDNPTRIEPRIVVTCLARALDVAAQFLPTHAITLLDPPMGTLAPQFGADVQATCLLFFDQERDEASRQVQLATTQLIDVLDAICSQREHSAIRLLVHCHAGASRSTAAAYIAMAMFSPAAVEQNVFDKLLRLTQRPWPNVRMVSVADQCLARAGRLVEPLQRYREKNPLRIQAYRRLNRKRGIISSVAR
jgi:predicted protein tyrosine phosphatase